VVKKLRPRIPLPRTLRGRLITGLVALLALGCATVGLVTYFAVQRTLSGELNSELQTATGLAYNCWATGFHSNADSDGQSSQQLTGGANASPGPSPSSVPSASGGASPSSSPISTQCTGLGEGTFVAVIKHGKPQCLLIGADEIARHARRVVGQQNRQPGHRDRHQLSVLLDLRGAPRRNDEVADAFAGRHHGDDERGRFNPGRAAGRRSVRRCRGVRGHDEELSARTAFRNRDLNH